MLSNSAHIHCIRFINGLIYGIEQYTPLFIASSILQYRNMKNSHTAFVRLKMRNVFEWCKICIRSDT